MNETDVDADAAPRMSPGEREYLLGRAEHHRHMHEITQDFGARATHQQFLRLYEARLAAIDVGDNNQFVAQDYQEP